MADYLCNDRPALSVENRISISELVFQQCQITLWQKRNTDISQDIG